MTDPGQTASKPPAEGDPADDSPRTPNAGAPSKPTPPPDAETPAGSTGKSESDDAPGESAERKSQPDQPAATKETSNAGAPVGMYVVISETPLTSTAAKPVKASRVAANRAEPSDAEPTATTPDTPPAASASPDKPAAQAPATATQSPPETSASDAEEPAKPHTTAVPDDSVAPGKVGRFFARVDQAAGGYAVDLALYALSAAFALVTALNSTLVPHRAWGSIAVWAYAAAFVVAGLQLTGHLIVRRRATEQRFLRAAFGNSGRAAVTWAVWGAAALLPLVVQTIQRADGRTDRAQEEVLVVERMGERLLNDGTPYLSRETIAALPTDERLMGYSPYQPGMSIFGIPRALFGDSWWTDARVFFALFTALCLIAAVLLLQLPSLRKPSRAGWGAEAVRRRRSYATVRALQAATVLPICALTLATGGDDIPVLAFCLLALALAATDRYGWAGVAVGAAAACKLFAFPVVAVLVVFAMAVARGGRLLPGAIGLPLLVLVPPFQADPDGFIENVIRFPLGHGLVTSPAQSPFPGYLIAQNVSNGRYVALGLLIAVAVAITVRILWWPPRGADSASLICGWGLLAAILLMPTTRFGYLLYPLAFLVWAAVLRPPTRPGDDAALRNPTATSRPLDDTALYRL